VILGKYYIFFLSLFYSCFFRSFICFFFVDYFLFLTKAITKQNKTKQNKTKQNKTIRLIVIAYSANPVLANLEAQKKYLVTPLEAFNYASHISYAPLASGNKKKIKRKKKKKNNLKKNGNKKKKK